MHYSFCNISLIKKKFSIKNHGKRSDWPLHVYLLSPRCTVIGTYCSDVFKNAMVIRFFQSHVRWTVYVLKSCGRHKNFLLQVLALYDNVEQISYENLYCKMSTLCLNFDTLSAVKSVPLLSRFFSILDLLAASFFHIYFLFSFLLSFQFRNFVCFLILFLLKYSFP
jgi:hypothetical protein